MCVNIQKLYEKLKSMDYKEYYEIESDFFPYLYANSKIRELSDINAFLIVSSWFGTSERSGVWTFYEATAQSNVQRAVDYLNQVGDSELAAIIERGIHDYQNPIYSGNFEYPEEWIDESNEIDDWIIEHSDWLWHWLYDFLIVNENRIIALNSGLSPKV